MNLCYSNQKYVAVAIIGRAILDHVPPVFGEEQFSDVVDHHNWSTSSKPPKNREPSAKKMMRRLEDSFRELANFQNHGHIRNSSDIFEQADVNFRGEFGILLAEVINILKTKK
jgi:hypothetical protein